MSVMKAVLLRILVRNEHHLTLIDMQTFKNNGSFAMIVGGHNRSIRRSQWMNFSLFNQ